MSGEIILQATGGPILQPSLPTRAITPPAATLCTSPPPSTTATRGGTTPRPRRLLDVVREGYARVSAASAMSVEDYYSEGRLAWLRLHGKGGNRHKDPAHHNAERYVDVYIDIAGIAGQRKSPLVRSLDTHRRLTDRPMNRNDALRMIKRRARAAVLSADTCRHTFRATGITADLEGGGTIDIGQPYCLL